MLLGDIPARLATGSVKSPFQKELQQALRQRVTTLTDLGLASPMPGGANLSGKLHENLRELARSDVGRRLEMKLGEYVGLKPGKGFTGVAHQVMHIAGQTHVVVRAGARFTLAPVTDSVQKTGHLLGRDVAVELPVRVPAGVTDLAQKRARLSARVRVLALDLSPQRDLGLGL